MTRRLLTLVVALLVLVGLLFAGAGWYFSGQIGSSALEVRPAKPTYDIAVTAVKTDSITLDDTDHRIDGLHRGFLYEIDWKGGRGRVSGPATESGSTVTRDFRLVSGQAPTVGTLVSPNRDLVPADAPGTPDPGTQVQVTSYTSPAGTFPAWFLPGDSSTWAVLVHGKGGSPAEMMRLGELTEAAGLPTLSIGYRNDGGQARDPSDQYGYGATEWRDLAAAVEQARSQGAEHVVLGGASMGGGIVASYLEHTDEAKGFVAGVILDAPMLDLTSTVEWGAAQEKLPLGLSLPGALTWTAERIAGVRYDLDWDAVDYLDDTSWVQEPVLVLHGDDDRTVPLATSRELATDNPDLVTLDVFDADHVESYNSDPQRYDAVVSEFLADLG